MNLKKGIFALILLSIVIFNTKVYIRHVNGSNGLLYNEIGNAYKNKKVNVTAHRGDSLNYPENTLSSILGAKELGADWIEIDVRKTIDNRLVVIHDSNLKRTTGIDREVYDATFDEIKDYNAGKYLGKNESVPLLDQVLEYAKRTKLKLYIELKIRDHEKNIIDDVVNLIKYYEFENSCVITSFDYDIIKELKMLNPHIKTSIIMKKLGDDIDRFEFADEFSINAKNIDRDIVDTIHLKNKKISAWTVDSEKEVIRMIDLKVDNIITNKIKLVKEIINNANYDL